MANNAAKGDGIDARDEISSVLDRIREATQIAFETSADVRQLAGGREHSDRLEFCAETVFADLERGAAAVKLIPR